MEEEISLRDYLIVLARKWWLILLVFMVATGGAGAYSLLQPNIYETRSRLLIIPRVTERLPGTEEVANPVGASLSIETLKNLAEANDLLAEVIRELNLRDPASDRLMVVESLTGMIKAKVELTGRGAGQSPLPLLTLMVRGKDPQLIARIADKWSQLFIERNAQLFATETARSFEFIRTQYEETEKALKSKQEEKLSYQRANPLTLLQAESQALTARYHDLLSALQQKRAALAEATARAQSLSTLIAQEPRVLRLKRAIPNESLFTLLGKNVTIDQLNALRELEVVDEELNPTYLKLKEQLDQAQTEVATYTAEIQALESQTAEIKERIEQLSERIAQVQVDLSRFDQELNILTSNFNRLAQSLQEARIAKEEQAGSIRLVETAIVPQVPVAPNRRLNVALGGTLGLFLGIVLAFTVHSIQGPGTPSKEETETQKTS